MTQEELNEYDRLTPRQKWSYDMVKKECPEWSHAQAILHVLVSESAALAITEGPSDISADSATLNEMLMAAIHNVQELMKSKFPRVYIQVEEKLSQILYEFANKQKTEIR